MRLLEITYQDITQAEDKSKSDLAKTECKLFRAYGLELKSEDADNFRLIYNQDISEDDSFSNDCLIIPVGCVVKIRWFYTPGDIIYEKEKDSKA